MMYHVLYTLVHTKLFQPLPPYYTLFVESPQLLTIGFKGVGVKKSPFHAVASFNVDSIKLMTYYFPNTFICIIKNTSNILQFLLYKEISKLLSNFRKTKLSQ